MFQLPAGNRRHFRVARGQLNDFLRNETSRCSGGRRTRPSACFRKSSIGKNIPVELFHEPPEICRTYARLHGLARDRMSALARTSPRSALGGGGPGHSAKVARS